MVVVVWLVKESGNSYLTKLDTTNLGQRNLFTLNNISLQKCNFHGNGLDQNDRL